MGGPPPRRWAFAVLAHPRHVALAGAVAGLILGPRAPGAAWWLELVPAVAALGGSRAGTVGYAAGVASRALVARRTGGRAGDALAHPVSVLALGLLVLVGVTHTDSVETAQALAGKLYELRILTGDESCASTGAPLLVVSQFTLYARTDKGRRPSWNLAAPGDRAEPLVIELVDELRRRGATVQTGVFGAMMQVASVNDGPFTVIVEVPPPSSP